jgi:uncharacterized integral membrane protein
VAEQGRDAGDVARVVGVTVLLVVIIAFVIDNIESVKVGFVVTERTLPLIWVLLVTLVLGALLDRIWVWRSRRHD